VLNLLQSAADKLQLITSAAGAIDVEPAWVDTDDTVTSASNMVPAGTPLNVTTAATTDIVPTPAAAKVRNVKFLSVHNSHASSSNTVTVQKVRTGPITAVLKKLTLLAGETLVFAEGVWYHYDALGAVYSTGGAIVDPARCDFRLSGVSLTPVMIADSTALATIYLAQYKGNHISLFDGVNWQDIAPAAEVSLAVTGRTTDLPFDIFGYISAGSAALEFLNWASATARATALVRLDGVLVKSGDATRRYLGSCRPRSATTFHWVRNGDDLPCKFDLFNVNNRVAFGFQLRALTNTWAYATATIRQAQALANYQVDVIAGLQEETFEATLSANSTTATTTINRGVAIGFDSTTAFIGMTGGSTNSAAVAAEQQSVAHASHQPTIGRHFYAWLEYGGTGVTFLGDNGALFRQSGMSGCWTC
jgi:hypothetical protein